MSPSLYRYLQVQCDRSICGWFCQPPGHDAYNNAQVDYNRWSRLETPLLSRIVGLIQARKKKKNPRLCTMLGAVVFFSFGTNMDANVKTKMATFCSAPTGRHSWSHDLCWQTLFSQCSWSDPKGEPLWLSSCLLWVEFSTLVNWYQRAPSIPFTLILAKYVWNSLCGARSVKMS